MKRPEPAAQLTPVLATLDELEGVAGVARGRAGLLAAQHPRGDALGPTVGALDLFGAVEIDSLVPALVPAEVVGGRLPAVLQQQGGPG